MPLTSDDVLTLLTSIIGLTITFLASVQGLLQQHAVPEPAARRHREESEPSTPGAATPTTTIPETPASPVTPPSPSAWRSPRVSNTQLLAEYRETGTCGHYWHQTTNPALLTCPICYAPKARRCPPS